MKLSKIKGERVFDVMLANMKVIMDSGQVVGLLAPGMDEELAKINARRARTV